MGSIRARDIRSNARAGSLFVARRPSLLRSTCAPRYSNWAFGQEGELT